ncbi:unnamed protein product [Mycena citricolor]|uniref:WD40 repeat-like protein n=1 Tax=Mycena citricolor TaxID=2018698 RepID=A0AAD2K3V2_9AGAR|nr:unnamed protein product [Mycena citricolor]
MGAHHMSWLVVLRLPRTASFLYRTAFAYPKTSSSTPGRRSLGRRPHICTMAETLLQNIPKYTLQHTLNTPAPITALAFGHSGHLYAASGTSIAPSSTHRLLGSQTGPPDDGSLRVYDLSSSKVVRAVHGLGEEISSLACLKRAGSELRDVWLALGCKMLLFRMDQEKLVQIEADALEVIEVEDKGDDVLNEICGLVKFIPDRPREIVSGGYDSCLLHFDFVQGTVLSRREIPVAASTEGMSLSPPFLMSAAFGGTGVMAAGTADGRIWVGCGGEKGVKAAKKRRKWDGLDPGHELIEKVSEGPIVAMSFSDPLTVTFSTLLGTVSQYTIFRQDDESHLVNIWQESTGVAKTNALVVDQHRFVVAGLTSNARGIIEMWCKS